MIIDDFLTLSEYGGLYCRIGNFYIDPQYPVQQAIISHAHGDHAVPGNIAIYCTPATAAIMACRYKKNAGEYFSTYAYNETFSINGVQISFISAGHILGSAQILLTYQDTRYLYTGDFKLQADLTCAPIEFIKADVLITETTFANPSIQHPDPIAEIQKLNNSQHHILLGTYALGKAQRLIKLINIHCPNFKILVHYAILPLNKIYESFGYSLGPYEPYQRKLMKDKVNKYIYMVPPMTFGSYRYAKNVVRTFASGWEKLQLHNDIALLISDHVDWRDIIKTIDNVQPKQIWTLHGDGSLLKAHYEHQILVKVLTVNGIYEKI